MLDGRRSSDSDGTIDSDGTNLSYRWRRLRGTDGRTVDLNGADTARPSFKADTLALGDDSVTHVFRLIVRDSEGNRSRRDLVTIEVSPFAALDAEAGPDETVDSGDEVTLEGSGTATENSRAVTYAWTRTGGTGTATVPLIGADTLQPTFTAETLTPGSDSATHIFELRVTDNKGSTAATDTVTITVLAPLFADAGADKIVASGDTVNLEGSGTATDGGRDVTYAWTRTGGDGDSSVTPSDPAALQPTVTAETLTPGATSVTHEFTLMVTDDQDSTEATDTVTITVLAPLDAEAGPDKTVISGDTVNLEGSGTASDSVRTVTYLWTRTGGDSSVTLSDPAVLQPTFVAETLTPGAASVTHEFTLTVTDNKGSTAATDTVTITVTPLPPLDAEAGPDKTVDSGDEVTLEGSGTATENSRAVTYAWTRTGGTGTATVPLIGADTLQPTFTAETLTPGSDSATHIFELRVTDNKGSTAATDTVTITVLAPLFADAGADKIVASGDTVNLEGSGTATDGGRDVTYAWTRTGGDGDSSVTPSDPAALQPTVTAETLTPGATSVTHEFTLMVTDDQDSTEATDTVTITVLAPLDAEAGPDKTVISGDTVNLEGSGTASDSVRTVTYLWTRTGGDSSVTLSNTAVLQPTFVAETLTPGAASVTHEFTLRVTDNKGSTAATDTVTITVTPLPPLDADAGADKTVISGDTVNLEGSGTATGSGRTVTYLWLRTDGDGDRAVMLSDPAVLQPTFVADTLTTGGASVTHTFMLIVRDNKGSTSAFDWVTITVTPLPALDAEAGPDKIVDSGDEVTLEGSGTATDIRRAVTYAWTRTGGTSTATVPLTGADTLQPTFTAETLTPGAASVTHEFTLRVTDNKGSTAATDTVTITVTPLPPLDADAGADKTVISGDTVNLEGSGTATGSGRTVTYLWLRTDGDGDRAVMLSDPAVLQPTFVADTLTAGGASVTHTFMLIVRDNKGSTSAFDWVTITVTPLPALDAEAGPDKIVDSGDEVTLEGSGTATDIRRAVTYAWTRTGGTSTATVPLTGADTLQPTFTAETLTPGAASVTHEFTLRVTDNKGSTAATDTVTITVTPLPPLDAEAGPDKTVDSGDEVTLEGSGTATDNSRAVTYAWTRTGGTGTATVPLTGADTLQPTFTAETLTPGAASVTHEFTLRVTDNKGSTAATDTVTITVTPLPPLDADAGADKTVISGDTVNLEGSGTATGSGRTVTYLWLRTDGDGDRAVMLSDPAVLQPTFVADTLTAGGASVTHTFMLIVRDNKGSTSAFDWVTITVTPLPTLDAEAGPDKIVDSGDEVTLEGSGTATDIRRAVTYAWTRTGGTSTATVPLTGADTLQPTFTAETLTPGAASVTHEFTLRVTDNKGSTAATDTVTITVTPLPALDAEAGPDKTVDSGDEVTLEGSGTATDNSRAVTYAWTRTGGTSTATVPLTGADTLQPTFTAETLTPGAASVTHEFTLRVTDNKGSTAATDTVTITVTPLPPLEADAGPDKIVISGDTVNLEGSGTATGSGRTVTYLWLRTDGDGDRAVMLSDPAVLQPTFVADTLTAGGASVTHTFMLIVRDNKGSTSAFDWVTITVTPLPALDAEAGPDETVDSGDEVTLEGSGTATDIRRAVTYAWTRTGGTSTATVPLTGADTLQPTFTADTLTPGAASVTHEFTLTVTDNKGSTAAVNTVTITVLAPLFADAGSDKTVASGGTVTLEGSGTATDSSRTVTYLWTRSGGTGDSSVAPSNPAALQTSFTAETLIPGAASVTHEFTLRVTDNKGSTAAINTVTITVLAPLDADAGSDKTVASGGAVTLEGSGTATGGGRTVTYLWTRSGGTGDSSVAPSNPAALQTSFTAETLIPGAASVTHEFTLRVTDNKGSTAATDTVTITVLAPLEADAGADKIVASGRTVTLEGSGTATGGGRAVTYAWTRTGGDGDSSVTPSDPAVLQPTVTAETLTPGAASVTHEFTLRVTDNKGSTAATDTVTITVLAPLEADAGADKIVASGRTVTLEGSGTATGGGRAVTYAWTRTGGDGDSSVTPSDTAVLQPTVTAETLTPGAASVTHEFTLRVTDNKGSTAATDTVTITVLAPLEADAGADKIVASGRTVTLEGSGTATGGGRAVTYAWTRTGGDGDSSVTPSDPAVLQPTVTAETLTPGAASVTHEFTLRVTDNKGSTAATDTVTITVLAPLEADAGADKIVASGRTVTLEGSGTATGGGRAVTYAWTRTGGDGDSSVTPSDPAVLQPTVTAETLTPGAASVTHEFTLRVTDNKGSTAATDTVTITVLAPLEADAGEDKIVASGRTVTLEGSGTATGGGRAVTYAWTRTGGDGDSSVTPSDPAVLQPTVTAETLTPGAASVTHEFTLRVTDNKGSTAATDTVTITVLAPLEADAGADKIVASGRTVTLEGSGTATGGDRAVTYAWTRTGGDGDSSVTPSDPAVLQPTVTAETLTPGAASVTHEFTLRVTDNKGSTAATDTVTITVLAPLEADAGADKIVASGRTVTLEGSGTATGGGRAVTYAWTRTGGDGDSSVTPSDPAVLQPTVTAETLTPGAASVTHEFTLRVTDNKGSTAATDTVTITVLAPLEADAGADKIVASGRTVTLEGSGTATGGGRAVTYAWTRTGGDGDSSVTPSDPAVLQPTVTAETLTPGAASVTHEFTLRVTDNKGSTAATDTVTITVLAPLEADAGADKIVASGRTVTLEGSGTATGGGRAVTYAWTRTGGDGDSSVTPSDPAVLQPTVTAETLTPGAASVTHEFTLRVTDNKGSTAATDTVTITVLAPLFADAGPDKIVASGRTVTLEGSGTASDSVRTVTYLWTGGDSSVTLSNTAVLQPTFVAETLTPGAASVTHTFALIVRDDQRSTLAINTVTITVLAPLEADAGADKIVASGRTVTLEGSGTATGGGRAVTYAWTRTGGDGDSSVTPSDPAVLQPTVTAETLTPGAASVTHEFTLRVTDNKGSTAAINTVTITVLAPLVADAGPDKIVASGGTVKLEGSGTATDSSRTVTYLWTRTGGDGDSSVTPSDPAVLQPTVTAETLTPGAASVTHEFTLRVTDNKGSTAATDTVTITVTSPIAAPVADAGDDKTVIPRATVELDGSGSTRDRRATLSYSWLQTGGTNVTLSDATAQKPTFTAENLAAGAANVTYVFDLTVTDDQKSPASTDTVTVTVEAPVRIIVKPDADAGPDKKVDSGARVTLDGRGSDDDDGTIVSYRWTRKGGSGDSGVTLTNKLTAEPSFTADTLRRGAADVTHIFSLVVTDNDDLESTPDQVTITVKSPNAAPIANAGPDQIVESGTRVTLDGRDSLDIDGDIVSYLWKRTGGSGDIGATLTNATTTQPSFAADTVATGAQNVTHVFSLVVKDDEGVISTANHVRITVEPTNLAPVAYAGRDQVVASGATVQLDGSGSYDEDGNIASYFWKRTSGSGDSNVALNGKNKAQLTFTADILELGARNVEHYFSLVVTDNDGKQSVADKVRVGVNANNTPPVVDAGPDQVVASGATVQLDGSGSWDPDGTVVSYRWYSIGFPAHNVTLTNKFTARPSFTAPRLASGATDVTYYFGLHVYDNGNAVSGCCLERVKVTVTARPIPVRPVADAGLDRTVASGATVQLDGRDSSIGDGITYSWTRTAGNGDSNVTLIDADTARPSFTADTLPPGSQDVWHRFALTVTNGNGVASLRDTVNVLVTANNVRPIADAGPYQTVSSRATVQLDGSRSWDSDGTILRYSWTSSDVTLTDADTAMPSFTADTLEPGVADVTHIIRLIVYDNGGMGSYSDKVRVTVTAPNIAPVAVASDDRRLLPARRFT